MSLLTIFNQGQTYLKTWPMHPKLGAIFPENRVIKATTFAQKMMPFIAVFAIVWQQMLAPHHFVALTAAILTALFALCLPLQGLYWLGKRATQALSPQSAVKYQQLFSQLCKENVAVMPVEKPTYQDLALLLQKAEQHLSTDFWNEL
ncbi:terminus macrodomain insulation protein YfbV [Pasteurellaceae bacterium 22721_9_1]